MTKKTDVPSVVALNFRDLFYLSAALAWHCVFPVALRQLLRLSPAQLHISLRSEEISLPGLLCAAYIGFAPLPTSYRNFIAHSMRVNKLEQHEESAVFQVDVQARERSAAGNFKLSRGELKRLLGELDVLAERYIGIASYGEIFNCKDVILTDTSEFSPTDRDTYAEGPLYLWDMAKAVNKHQLTNMRFGTFEGWVLFLYQMEESVFGHALFPASLRHGGNYENPYGYEIQQRMEMGFPTSYFDVPEAVERAVARFADQHFPGNNFKLVPPPMIFDGRAVPSWRDPINPSRHPTEG